MKLTISAARIETARILTILIERVYGDGVDQIVEWRQNPDKSFSGVFLDRGKGPFQFILNDQGLNYYSVPVESTPKRLDSYIDFLLETAPLQVVEAVIDSGFERFDGPRKAPRKARAAVPARQWRKPKNCSSDSSISCGYSCISKSYICHVGRRNLATPQEFSVLQSVVAQTAVAAEPEPKSEEPAPAPPKPLDKMTIRELRAEAQARGVPGYSHVNKDVLLAAIQSYDAEPAAQRLITKTIARREAQRQADPLKAFTDFWGLTRKIGAAKVITASTLLTVGAVVWTPVAGRYTGNYSESANMAKASAKTVPVEDMGDKTNLTFVVNRGRTEEDDIGLEAGLKQADPDFFKDHHFVSLEMDGKPVPQGQRRKNLGDAVENYNAVAGHLADSLIMGRNPQAVQLAAQVLKNGRELIDSEGNLSRQINLVGDREGGLIVNEAIEILKEADKKIAAQVRVVMIGTPDLGLRTNDIGSENHHTITSREDPMFLLPKRNPIAVNDVKGGKLKDYLASPYAVDAIAGSLGKHDTTPNSPPPPPWQLPKDKKDPTDPRNSRLFGLDATGKADPASAVNALKQRFGYATMKQKEKLLFGEWARAEADRISVENERAFIKRVKNEPKNTKRREKRKREKLETLNSGTANTASTGIVNAPIDSVIPPPPETPPERKDSAYWKAYHRTAIAVRLKK